MVRAAVGLVAVLVGLLGVEAFAQQAAPPIPVSVVGATNNALSFTTLEPQLDWPIFVRRNEAGESPRQARIDVTDLISPSGRQQPVKLRKDGADFDGALSLPALGQIAVHLVAAMPEEGPYTGEIGVIVDGKRQPVAIRITRAVREMVVVGATGGALQITTPDPELNWPLMIRRNDNAPGARDVQIELGNLIAPSGQEAKLELRPGNTPKTASVSLQPLRQATLDLVGKLLEEGVHNGEIGLVVDGKRFSTALKITRTLKESSVRIEDISQVRTTVDRAGVFMRLRLKGSDEHDVAVHAPEFAKLDRKEGNGLIQAKYNGLRIFFEGKPAPAALAIKAGNTADLALFIAGLNEPGVYSGVVRVSSPNRKPVEKSFEISLRASIWLATICIIVGVILSTAVRLYLTIGRSSLVAQRDALNVRETLLQFQRTSTDLGSEEQRILSMLVSRLDAVRLGQSDRSWGTPDAQVDEIRRKVVVFSRWVLLRRQMDAVTPPEVADAARQKHKAIATILEKPAATKAETDQAETDLQALKTELAKALQDLLVQTINVLRSDIAALPPDQRLALAPTDRQLELASARATAGNVSEAAPILSEARRAYVQVAARALQASLDPANHAPGFDPPGWIAFTQEYKRRLEVILAEPDAETQINAWKSLRIEWLRAVSEPLRVDIEALLSNATAAAAASPGDPNLAAAKAEFEKAKAEVDSILPLLAAKKVQDAMKAYTDAVASYQKGVAAMGGRLGGTPAPQPAAVTTAGAEIPPSVLQGAWDGIAIVLGAPATAAQANTRIAIAESLLFLVLLAVALVIGLKFLYFDNASWGSFTDLAVAFIWGFGLHQFAGTAFQGVQSIAQQIVGAR